VPVYEIYKRDGTPVRVEGPEGATFSELVNLHGRQTTTPTKVDRQAQIDTLLRESERLKPITTGQQIGETFKGIASGGIGMLESGALGLISPMPERSEAPIRGGIQAVGDFVQDYLAPAPNVQARMEEDTFRTATIPRKFGEALGSFGGILATAAVNPLAATGLAVTAGAGEASERAREAEATEAERGLATAGGALVGATELISPLRIINKFKKAVGNNFTEKLRQKGLRILAEGGVEGLQEFSATVAQNLIEQNIYNPEKGTFVGSDEAAGFGAGVGGFVQAITEMIAPRARRRRQDREQEAFEKFFAQPEPEVEVEPEFVQQEMFDQDLGTATDETVGATATDEDLQPDQQRDVQPDLFDEAAAGIDEAFQPKVKAGPVDTMALQQQKKFATERFGQPLAELDKKIAVAKGKERDDLKLERSKLLAEQAAVEAEAQTGALETGAASLEAQRAAQAKSREDMQQTDLFARTEQLKAELGVSDAEIAQVREDVKNKEVQQVNEGKTRRFQELVGSVYQEENTKLLQEYENRFNEVATPEQKVVDQGFGKATQDNTSVKDKNDITNLLTGKTKLSKQGVKNKSAAGAKEYFSSYSSPENALDEIAHGIVQETVVYREEDDVKYIRSIVSEDVGMLEAVGSLLAYSDVAKGKGQRSASRAREWVDANLSNQAKQALAVKVSKEIKDKTAISIQEQSEVGIINTLGKKPEAGDVSLLPSSEMFSLSLSLSPTTRALLRAGNIKGALDFLGKKDVLPQEIAVLVKRLSEKIGNTKVTVNDNLGAIAGLFDPKTNTIELNGKTGMNVHVLLHEGAHAVTSATLANKSHPVTKQLTALFNNVKDKLDTAYGSQSLEEFVSETFSNPKFQQTLAKININGEPTSALQRFYNTVVNLLRQVMGKNTTPLTALDSASRDIEQIMAPAPEFRDAGKFLMSSDPDLANKTIKGMVKRYMNRPALNKEEKTGFIRGLFNFLGDTKIADLAKDASLGFADLLTITDIADKGGFGGLGDTLNKLVNRQRGRVDEAGKKFDKTLQQLIPLLENKKTRDLLDDLIYNEKHGATIYQVDPFDPKGESAYKDKKGNPILDKDGNNLLDIYKTQQAIIKEMGANGVQAYKLMNQYYTSEFKELKDVIFKQVQEQGVDGDSANKIRNVFEKIFEDKSLKVYFPLVREGDYVLEYNDPTLDGDPRVVEFLGSTRAANDRKQYLISKGVKQETFKDYKRKEADARFREAPTASFIGQIMDIVGGSKADETTKNNIKEDITTLFINNLPETSFAKSLAKRKGTFGYEKDSVFAFKQKGYALSRQVAQLKSRAEIRNVGRQIEKRANELSSAVQNPEANKKFFENFGINYGELSRVGITAPSVSRLNAELQERIKFATTGAKYKSLERFVKTANQGAFIYTIGFNASSAVVNLSQIPLVVQPYLGGQFGEVQAMKAIGKAYSLVNGSGNAIDGYFDENFNVQDRVVGFKGYAQRFFGKEAETIPVSDKQKKEMASFAPLVKLASDRGQLTRAFLADALGLSETGLTSGKKQLDPSLKTAGRALDGIAALSAIPFNQAERLNRQVTLMASYELALRKEVGLKDSADFSQVFNKSTEAQQSKAAEFAMRSSQETNGGAVLETAPRLTQQHFFRVAMMYKTYGLRMYTTMLNSTKALIDASKTGEERKIALKQLGGVLASSAFFAGAQGIPIYGAIELIYNLLADDDEEDFDTLTRQAIGELAYKGPVNAMFGIDVASRVRLTGLLIQENRYNKDSSWEENLLFYIGGPAGSTVERIIRGAKDLTSEDGTVERAMESFLPTGIANMYKAVGRVRREGYKTRRGDAIFDDVTGLDLGFLLFGFPPVQYTNEMEKNNIVKGIDNAVSKKRSKILKAYYVAMRQGDVEGFNNAERRIAEFNEKNPNARISFDSIKKSMTRHKKTSENIRKHNGVFIQNTDVIKEVADAFDNKYTFFD